MKLKVLLLVFTLALTGSAFGTEFHFTFTGNDLNATGTLTGDSLGGGIFQITSGHINITGDITASGDLIPTPDPAPSVYTSPSGQFYYDNQLFTGVTPQLDLSGLLFSVPYEVNIFENPPTYLSFVGSNGYEFHTGEFRATTPEPSSLALLGTGILGALGVLRRRRLL